MLNLIPVVQKSVTVSMAIILCFQTKLHDGVCQKRQAATIATHDLKSVKLPLKYDAQFPQVLQVL